MSKEILQSNEILDASPYGVLAIDKNSKIIFASNLCNGLFNMGKEDLLGISIYDIIQPSSADSFKNFQNLLFSNSSQTPTSINIQSLRRTDSWMRLNGSVVKFSKTDDPSILIFVDETNEQENNETKLEKEVALLRERNEQLKQYIDSNLQLENFAYIATHDLKAPLRSVISFAKLLKESAENKLDVKENKFLKIVSDSSHHMKELIDDLLTFSKVNTNDTVITQFDPNEIISEVIEDLEDDIANYQAIIEKDTLPKLINADRQKISLVFQNLITNAIKFQSENQAPAVKIDIIEGHEEWTAQIRDNGIGIDENHIDKIFLVFQKLHSKDKFGGSGMGLAICKKVIEQHKGKIWAKNNLDGGCTISFSIPKNPESPNI